MKCFYCPQKDASLVPWDSLSPTDQTFLRDKYPGAGHAAVCALCVGSARPSAFFSRCSSSTSLSAPKSVDSGLQVPSAALVGPIRFTTAGQVAKSVLAGSEPQLIDLSHWAYTTRMMTTSGRPLLKDDLQTEG